MVEHTPGPWRVECYSVTSEFRPGERILMFNVLAPNPDAGKQGVCYAGDHFSIAHSLDCEADARLIAAAPDLLEALEAAADTLANLAVQADVTNPLVRNADLVLEAAEGERAAREAIAKARGERYG